MKRGTKTILFIASMGITIASLAAIFGPCRHHQRWGYGYGNHANLNNLSCGDHGRWHDKTPSATPETK